MFKWYWIVGCLTLGIELYVIIGFSNFDYGLSALGLQFGLLVPAQSFALVFKCCCLFFFLALLPYLCTFFSCFCPVPCSNLHFFRPYSNSVFAVTNNLAYLWLPLHFTICFHVGLFTISFSIYPLILVRMIGKPREYF